MDGLEEIPEIIRSVSISFPIPASEIGRILPSREVTRKTITDSYIKFILFCNPTYSDDTDTLALRDTFNTPPSSNRKTFDVFNIFVLVKRLHEYNGIKTWQQLALELGVEPGTSEDGAGSQRVPQYIVRLKKWMKVTHIDAFFNYLMGRPDDYYQDIPPLSDPHPPEGRDGVLPNEDFALRALDPRLRPKRGRKRAETPMDDLPPAQRHTFSTIADDRRAILGAPLSAMPHSAFPESAMTDRIHDPWSSISAQFPSAIGMSAIEPRSAFSAFTTDPRYDTQSSPATSKRIKWKSKTDVIQSRSVTGTPMTPYSHLRPFSSPHSDDSVPSHSAARRMQPPPFSMPPEPTTAVNAAHTDHSVGLMLETAGLGPTASTAEQPSSAVSAVSTSSRRERQRLQLQVPQHSGPPVRLITPPPPAKDVKPGHDDISAAHVGTVMTSQAASGVDNQIEVLYDSLQRSLAADLLRGEVTTRPEGLTGGEARLLAGALLQRMGLPARAEVDVETLLVVSVNLGLTHTIRFDEVLDLPLAFPSLGAEKSICIQRFAVDKDGFEEPTALDDSRSGTKDVFDVFWTISRGGLQGKMSVKNLELKTSHGHDNNMEGEPRTTARESAVLQNLQHQSIRVMNSVRTRMGDSSLRRGVQQDGARPDAAGLDWREKYFELERLNKGMHSVLEQVKDKMIEVVLDL